MKKSDKLHKEDDEDIQQILNVFQGKKLKEYDGVVDFGFVYKPEFNLKVPDKDMKVNPKVRKEITANIVEKKKKNDDDVINLF